LQFSEYMHKYNVVDGLELLYKSLITVVGVSNLRRASLNKIIKLLTMCYCCFGPCSSDGSSLQTPCAMDIMSENSLRLIP
jgi:hypothetical protein